MSSIVIREIQKQDNTALATLIREVLVEMNVPKVGTAYADPQLDFMFETYDSARSIYFVLEKDGLLLGGGGVSQLENEVPTLCELQKMYFLPTARGQGLGAQLIQKCLQSAAAFGYEQCYLETMPNMVAAQQLYLKMGFSYICSPLGSTGHVSCPVWMLKDLK